MILLIDMYWNSIINEYSMSDIQKVKELVKQSNFPKGEYILLDTDNLKSEKFLIMSKTEKGPKMSNKLTSNELAFYNEAKAIFKQMGGQFIQNKETGETFAFYPGVPGGNIYYVSTSICNKKDKWNKKRGKYTALNKNFIPIKKESLDCLFFDL